MSENIFNLPSGKVQNETKDVLQQIANTLGTSIDTVSRMSNVEELVSSVIDGDIQGVLNNELIATDIANKLNAKETEYAPKLTEVATQLAQKAAKDEARLKSQKLELEDLSPSALSAIEGGKGTEFNLLTIPQPNSVTPLTLSKDVSGLNNYSTISTYMNGKLTKIEEKDGLVSKKITILAYGADGKLNSVKESRQGGGTETHLSYEGGGVSTSKTSWVAKTYVLKGSDVFLLETAGTETDYASFHIPEDAVAGTQGVDYVARLYKKDGTEIREIPSTQRTTAEGTGGFYWSTTRVSLVFEKDKYASLEEAKAALAGLVLQYKIK